jgi:hypothetical protein
MLKINRAYRKQNEDDTFSAWTLSQFHEERDHIIPIFLNRASVTKAHRQ